MPRSGQEARDRLRQATLELFEQQGYEVTTAAQIAARAGVTERTFFRHFTDKREALFDGDEEFIGTLGDAVIGAPVELGPTDALLYAFRSVGPVLERNRAFSVPRQSIIAKTPALQERAATKAARLTLALADALRRRAVEEGAAAIASQVAMAISSAATLAWMNDPAATFSTHLARAHAKLRRLLG